MTPPARSRYDAIIVGAGINGMVAAAELAGAGWSVALVDVRDRIGGFIESAELTAPGFIHDTYSSWHPLFMAGPGFATLGADLQRHGLSYCTTDAAVTASVSERGTVIADRSPEVTAESLAGSDRANYLAMLADLERWSPHVFGALGSELSDPAIVKLGATALRRLGRRGFDDLLRVSTQSGRAFARERFTGWEVDQLWAPWLLHAGLSPDHASGGLMLPVMAFTMHGLGLPVVAGGAGRFVDAFEALLVERGVDLLVGREVTGIQVSGGRAVGVDTDQGPLHATQAVVASTSTAALYDQLLPQGAVSDRGRRSVARHRPGRAAMQLHFALDAPLSWSDSALNEVALIHISDGSASTGIACAHAEAGLLPAEPTVVVGQQCVLDSSRAPQGKATLWVQLQEVPWAPVGDAAGQLDTSSGWSDELVAGYTERVLDRIAEFAPGVKASVLASHAISPTGLQAANRNAVAGDPYGGAADLDQSLLWRPGTGTGHLTDVAGLFQIGAFTHPGPGLGGGSGHLVAQRLITTSEGLLKKSGTLLAKSQGLFKKSPLSRLIER